MPIQQTYEWFQEAVPKPTKKTQRVQLGVHVEEFVEMLVEMNVEGYNSALADAIVSLNVLANGLKKDPLAILQIKDRQAFFDALNDQIVTATGTAYTQGMNIIGGLTEVNRSNYSKFVDGKAVFDANGKIAKGPTYSKPDLTPYVGIDITELENPPL